MSNEQLIERSAQAVTYGGASGAVYFGMTANEFAAIAGVVIGVIGLVVQVAVTIYFKRLHLAITARAAKAKPMCSVCPARRHDD
jgi:hypothetical protein